MKQSDDEFLKSLAEPLRAPVQQSAGFEARVMAEVSSVWRDPARRAPAGFPEPVLIVPDRPVGRPSGAVAWMVRPRAVFISPLAGLAAAAGIAIAVLTVGGGGFNRGTRPMAASTPVAAETAVGADTIKLVQFMLVAPSASSVTLVGDFNDWDPAATPLREDADAGVWAVTIPIRAGRHQYVFMVNGTRWTPDPAAPRAVEDSFGMPNSVITVGESAT